MATMWKNNRPRRSSLRDALWLLILVPHLAAPCAESPAPAPAPEPRDGKKSSLTTLSILPFASTTDVKEGEKKVGERMTEELQVLLSESGRFRILTRSEMTLEKMNKLIELQAQQGKAEERAPFQRLSCEEAFISGTIHRNDDQSYAVYLDVISLATGEKLIALRMRCWHENAFRRLARAFTREIVSRVDIAGTIVKTQAEKFFVEVARGPEGVKAGDFLEVRHPSQVIKDAGKEIDPGEEPVCGTLVVEAITSTGHLRCVRKPNDESKASLAPGDKVRLVPAVPVEGRRPNVAIRPFTVAAADDPKKEAQEEFANLVREELIVSAPEINGMKVANVPGMLKVSAPEADDRVVCDALGVDALLTARLSMRGKKVRLFVNLVPHAQRECYEREPKTAEASIAKTVSVDLEADDTPTPEAAIKAAEEIVVAFTPQKS
jgi:TolB-like protein